MPVIYRGSAVPKGYLCKTWSLSPNVYRNLNSLGIKPRERAFKQFKSPVLNVLTDTWKLFLCERRYWLITKFRLQNGRAWLHTCEGGNSKLLSNIQQDTKKRYKKGYPERKHKKMQIQWEETPKGAITKEFFPSAERRQAVNLNLSPNVTTIMTGHGIIRFYLHRLKFIASPQCPCKHGIQTVDHLIFQCKRVKNEREILKSSVLNTLRTGLLNCLNARLRGLTFRLRASCI